MKRRSRGYEPLYASPEQDYLLDVIVSRADAAGERGVGVFDLDGCLFDTRPRQVRIFREYASRTGLLDLYRVREEHFRDWDLKNTLLNAGFEEAAAEVLYPKLREHWWRHFFTSDYVVYDHAMPGAADLVCRCARAGMHVVYLTGRDDTMRAGTEQSLQRFGFPYASGRATLLVKPDFHMDDTEWKEQALQVIASLGRPVVVLDNEPANVNLFRERYPEAFVVFVETDHSEKPDLPRTGIPWLRSFLRSSSMAAP